MQITCCKGCTKRYPACHDHCKTFLKQKAEKQKENEAERKARYLESALRTHHYTSR